MVSIARKVGAARAVSIDLDQVGCPIKTVWPVLPEERAFGAPVGSRQGP